MPFVLNSGIMSKTLSALSMLQFPKAAEKQKMPFQIAKWRRANLLMIFSFVHCSFVKLRF